MDDAELARRSRLTFEQAEGAAPLPAQLAPRVLSPEMRARLWKVVHDSINDSSRRPPNASRYVLSNDWNAVLAGWSLEILHKFVDDFTGLRDPWIKSLRGIFETEGYTRTLGFIQYSLRHPQCPPKFPEAVANALTLSHSAYRVFDGKTIAPMASKLEADTLTKALADLSNANMKGATVHLHEAATCLSGGRWADSVRESIHAVESVVRVVGHSKSVDEALKKLSHQGYINKNVSAGLGRLYNYTSDEQGIRHPLLDDGDAKVDEADALYMLGASAAFVSYLLGKGRLAGLLS